MFVSEAFRIPESRPRLSPPAVLSLAFDRVQLADQLLLAVDALPVLSDGPDETVTRTAGSVGVDACDVVVLKIRSRLRGFTLVLATSQAWDLRKPALCALKHASRLQGRRVILVPAGRLRRPDFLSNCAMLSLSKRMAVSATERMAVLEYVALDPNASLRDCAQTIPEAADPIGVVMCMVAQGLLRIDLGRRITSDAKVLPARSASLATP
ncbi:MAG: hypothetical protein DI534_14980 [Leifsonia xyli]|nr:MAG: hypothetical protein DI534_14980 [Leifsonia xyli]